MCESALMAPSLLFGVDCQLRWTNIQPSDFVALRDIELREGDSGSNSLALSGTCRTNSIVVHGQSHMTDLYSVF
jgi:hypothetical protein